MWPSHVTCDWHWSIHLQYFLSFYIFFHTHISSFLYFFLFLCLLSSSLFILSDIIFRISLLWSFFIRFLFFLFLPFYHFCSFTFPVLLYCAYLTHILWTVILHVSLFYKRSLFSKALQSLFHYSFIQLRRSMPCIISIAFQSEFPTEYVLVLHVSSANNFSFP